MEKMNEAVGTNNSITMGGGGKQIGRLFKSK